MVQCFLKKGKICMNFTITSRLDDHSNCIADILKAKCEAIGWNYDEEDFDIVLSVGGDGTLLRSIHQYLDKLESILFVGIHTGTLGFLTDYTDEELDLFIEDILKDHYTVEKAPLLQMDVPERNQTIYALNEVRIESLTKTVSFDVYIDHEFFEKATGSGICVSSQAGSTAVNRALQGAVIDSGLNVLQLCEIMPIAHRSHHSLRNPYIMKEDRILTIQGDSLSFSHACYDHLEMDLEGVHKVRIHNSNKFVQFVRYREYSYLKRLKSLY